MWISSNQTTISIKITMDMALSSFDNSQGTLELGALIRNLSYLCARAWLLDNMGGCWRSDW